MAKPFPCEIPLLTAKCEYALRALCYFHGCCTMATWLQFLLAGIGVFILMGFARSMRSVGYMLALCALLLFVSGVLLLVHEPWVFAAPESVPHTSPKGAVLFGVGLGIAAIGPQVFGVIVLGLAAWIGKTARAMLR
jgi:hypothetical protein